MNTGGNEGGEEGAAVDGVVGLYQFAIPRTDNDPGFGGGYDIQSALQRKRPWSFVTRRVLAVQQALGDNIQERGDIAGENEAIVFSPRRLPPGHRMTGAGNEIVRFRVAEELGRREVLGNHYWIAGAGISYYWSRGWQGHLPPFWPSHTSSSAASECLF